MLVSITGTPGVGKSTLSREMEVRGWERIDLKELIKENGWSEGSLEKTGEIIVDKEKLKEQLEMMEFDPGGNILIDGHLSYLAPSDISIVLRLDPRKMRARLQERGYSEEKIMENLEAEGVSVILVEAGELETERSGGRDWSELDHGKGIVFEIDTTDRSVDELVDRVMDIVDSYQGKRLNELVEYRPGRIDWLEVIAGWF